MSKHTGGGWPAKAEPKKREVVCKVCGQQFTSKFPRQLVCDNKRCKAINLATAAAKREIRAVFGHDVKFVFVLDDEPREQAPGPDGPGLITGRED